MRTLLLAAAFCVAILPASSQDKKPDDTKKPEAKKLPRIAINDPAKLKDVKEYEWQGEFEGTFPDKGNHKGLKFGIQLIARGEGKFVSAAFENGLPGQNENVKLLKDKLQSSILQEGKLKMDDSTSYAELKDGNLHMVGGDGNVLAKRVERKSPTLDAKPPEGAIVLFNGPDDLAKWDAKAKIVELSDGKFLGVGGRTKQKFQSFTLHVEFRLPFMPNSTGQARGNSGVYIQDRYEVQVLDSFGLPLHDNECGGIYKESAPKVNMCFPPMTWQTYDIDFTAATFADGKKTKPSVITVKHNGVVIHDKLELKNNTPGGGINKEVPEPGALYLQDHGDPVVYRNIWIVEKK